MLTDLASLRANGTRVVQAAQAPRGGARAVADGKPDPVQREQEASAAELRRAIDDAIARLTEKGAELTFELDHDLGRVIVRLVDRNTREVVRQVPSKEALAVARALRDGGTVGTLVSTDA